MQVETDGEEAIAGHRLVMGGGIAGEKGSVRAGSHHRLSDHRLRRVLLFDHRLRRVLPSDHRL
jgi:hypothetical protein